MTEFPPPGPSWQSPVPQSSGKAVTALVLGILGIFLCGPFTAIPAILIGRSAQREIDASAGWKTGRSAATAGVVLGWIEVVISALGLLLVAGLLASGGSIEVGSG